jgi:hypothetical protein
MLRRAKQQLVKPSITERSGVSKPLSDNYMTLNFCEGFGQNYLDKFHHMYKAVK